MEEDQPQEFQPDGPESEVWNHLESGWQQAYDDMVNRLPPRKRKLYLGVAAILVDLNFKLVVNPSDPGVAAAATTDFPEIDASFFATPEVVQAVFQRYLSGANAWLRHAVELELAGRMPGFEEAVSRFNLLAPQFAERPVPERARPYLAEAVSTFVFGFDPACIALCRSTFEQVAKSILIENAVYSEPQIRREMPTATTLLEKLRQSGKCPKTYDKAKLLIERGNTILHRHMFEEKILRQQAFKSVSELVKVLSELLS